MDTLRDFPGSKKSVIKIGKKYEARGRRVVMKKGEELKFLRLGITRKKNK
jgi:hypothetical protein